MFFLFFDFFAGLLTLSKVFFVFIMSFYVIYNLTFKRFFQLVVISSMFFFIFNYLFQEGMLGRLIQLIYFFEDYESYSAYIIWKDSVLYLDNIFNTLVGKGLGVFSRGGQSMGGYTLLHGSTESFFIQLYVELGLIGLVLFLYLLSRAYFKLLNLDKRVACGFASICIVGLFTPAPYGFVCGSLIYFCLTSGLYVKRVDSVIGESEF